MVIIYGLYRYCFCEYSPPHFKGRNKFSDLEDAVKCLYTFGYHGAFLEIEQCSVVKGFTIMKYFEQEKYGLEFPMFLHSWSEEELNKMKKCCDESKMEIIEFNSSSEIDRALFFDCKDNVDMAFKFTKFICLDILEMDPNKKVDYRFYHLSVYEEFPSISDHPKGWGFKHPKNMN